jgi:hypothetical protein
MAKNSAKGTHSSSATRRPRPELGIHRGIRRNRLPLTVAELVVILPITPGLRFWFKKNLHGIASDGTNSTLGSKAKVWGVVNISMGKSGWTLFCMDQTASSCPTGTDTIKTRLASS